MERIRLVSLVSSEQYKHAWSSLWAECAALQSSIFVSSGTEDDDCLLLSGRLTSLRKALWSLTCFHEETDTCFYGFSSGSHPPGYCYNRNPLTLSPVIVFESHKQLIHVVSKVYLAFERCCGFVKESWGWSWCKEEKEETEEKEGEAKLRRNQVWLCLWFSGHKGFCFV